VPDLTGTSDGTASGTLVDSTNTFSDYSVFKGAKLYNITDNTNTEVSVSPTASGANLALDDDIMASGEDYCIHLTDPVGLDSFASNIGAVYNDSGSDLRTTIQQGKRVYFDDERTMNDGTSATLAPVTSVESYVPVTAKRYYGWVVAQENSGTQATAQFASSSLGVGRVQLSNRAAGNGSNVLEINSQIIIEMIYPQKIYYAKTSGDVVDVWASGYELK